MSKSSVTQLGYFIKRMKDCGYRVDKLYTGFTETDPRLWTVVIDGGCSSVFCTYYQNANKEDIKKSEIGDNYFEIYDGGQFLPSNVKYKTSSIEVLVEYLNQHGIVNKHPDYSKRILDTK